MKFNSTAFIIVDRGKAKDLMNCANKIGIKRGVVFLGEGTKQSKLLDTFGINRTEKEVVMLGVPGDKEEELYHAIGTEFELHKKYRGIAFSVPCVRFAPGLNEAFRSREEEVYDTDYVCLTAILEKDCAFDAMEIARSAGVKGGTILRAHGAGVPREAFAPIMIEPQKDILMLVTKRDNARELREAIYMGMGLVRKGAGLIFALPVRRTVGLYEDRHVDKKMFEEASR